MATVSTRLHSWVTKVVVWASNRADRIIDCRVFYDSARRNSLSDTAVVTVTLLVLYPLLGRPLDCMSVYRVQYRCFRYVLGTSALPAEPGRAGPSRAGPRRAEPCWLPAAEDPDLSLLKTRSSRVLTAPQLPQAKIPNHKSPQT